MRCFITLLYCACHIKPQRSTVRDSQMYSPHGTALKITFHALRKTTTKIHRSSWVFVLDHRVFVLDQWVFVLDHRVFVLDHRVFVLDQWVLGLRSSFLGLRFRHIL